MNNRHLGRSGLVSSMLGFGCMGLSDFYESSAGSDAEAIALIHRALELGVTMLDTADMYGPFENEELVGKAIRDRRDRVVLATKFGIMRDPDGTPRGVCGRPDYVRACCEDSLRRLGVDTIDLYYQHRVDPAVPIEETVGAMGELVRQGKVRHLGLSEAAPATIRRAHKVHRISVLQTEYSLWTRDPEETILPTVRELGIGFVAYSPLGRGFLAGRFGSHGEIAAADYRRDSPRFRPENFSRNLALLEQIKSIAAARGCSPAQLALAWLFARGEDIVPIPGTTRRDRLEENCAASAIELTPAELAQIDAAAPRAVAAGERYPERTMHLVDR
ncbi:MAG: aldo/keto reductase [Gammaproteobacteria bacterium]|nr:aldo/keto reductase [Gammaproteobacteria bacterium]